VNKNDIASHQIPDVARQCVRDRRSSVRESSTLRTVNGWCWRLAGRMCWRPCSNHWN